MTKKHNNPRRLWRILLTVLITVAVVALVIASVYYALYWSGRAALFDREGSLDAPESLVDSIEDDGRTVEYRGQTYRYNDAVVSLLFMGVDKTSLNLDAGYGHNGQADSLFVAAIDTRDGTVSILPLSRETMVDVNLYSVTGSYAGVEKTQLCLAFAYAATAQDGCENVARSVSRLLYGMPVDGYIAIDMDGVAALNAAVGGVEVTSLEDITLHNNGNPVFIKQGQRIRLGRNTVLDYVRHRDQDVNANNRRMARQKQFLTEFIRTAADSAKKDFTKIEKYYAAAKPYTVSDLDLKKITYLASTYLVGGRTALDYVSIVGDTVMGENHVEFYPDDTSLYETILKVYYETP